MFEWALPCPSSQCTTQSLGSNLKRDIAFFSRSSHYDNLSVRPSSSIISELRCILSNWVLKWSSTRCPCLKIRARSVRTSCFSFHPGSFRPTSPTSSSRKALLPTGGPTQWRHDTTDLELGAIQLSIPSVIAIDTRTRNSRWPWRNASFSASSWRLKAKSPEKSHLPSMAGEGYFSETKMGNILKSTCLPSI